MNVEARAMPALLLVGGASAVLDWFAVGTGRRKVEILTKPVTMLLLLAWFVLAIPRPWPAMDVWFAAGLAASLVGDVFLLHAEKWFVHGLAAFLLAQLAYVAALNSEGPVLTGRSGVAALAVVAVSSWFLVRLRKGLRRTGADRMVVPVTVYLATISAMVWSAACATLRPEWPAATAGLVAIGGALFYASDAILAWNRFIRPFPGARLLTRVTYHLGQFGLAVGMALALPA
jgi:uncharacterized membrane protein YhhN